MRFNYLYVVVFFGTVALAALLLFPTSLDVVTLYRQSFLYGTALEALEELEAVDESGRFDLERARVLFLVGRYDDAVKALLRMTAAHPQDPEGWRQLAHTYRAIQQPQRVIETLEQLTHVAPADSEALYLLDEYYRWFQMSDKAVVNLQALVEHFPDDYDNYDKLVDLYMRMGRGEAAAGLLTTMAEVFADSSDAMLDLGQVYLSQRDSRAVEVFEGLHRRHPDRADYVDGLCSAFIVAGRRQQALELFEAFYRPRLEPGRYQARLARTYIYLSEKRNAMAALERSLELSPRAADRVLLVQLYAELGNYLQAAHHAGQLVQEAPDRRPYWSTWVAYLATAGMRQELVAALEEYRRRWPDDRAMELELADAYQWIEDASREAAVLAGLLASDPDSETLQARLAQARVALGDVQGAAASYARLLRRRPRSSEYQRGLLEALEARPELSRAEEYAVLLYEATGGTSARPALLLAGRWEDAGAIEKAERLYGDLLAAHAESSQLHSRVGQLILEHGRLAAAQPYFERALDLDADNTLALSGLAHIVVDDNPDAAVGLLVRLAELWPLDPDTAYRLGLAYEAERDTVAMERQFRRLLELEPGPPTDDPYPLRRHAYARSRTGAPEAAMTALKTALQLFPDDRGVRNDYAELLLLQGAHAEALDLLRESPGARR